MSQMDCQHGIMMVIEFRINDSAYYAIAPIYDVSLKKIFAKVNFFIIYDADDSIDDKRFKLQLEYAIGTIGDVIKTCDNIISRECVIKNLPEFNLVEKDIILKKDYIYMFKLTRITASENDYEGPICLKDNDLPLIIGF